MYEIIFLLYFMWSEYNNVTTPEVEVTLPKPATNSVVVIQSSLNITEATNAAVKAVVHKAEMVEVTGGSFRMGDEKGIGEPDERPVQPVWLSNFSISPYEITFEEYDRYCQITGKHYPTDDGLGRGKRPVVNIDWYDAVEYCNWKSIEDGFAPCYYIDKKHSDSANLNDYDQKKWTVVWDPTKNGYRLPTEAEWEYAAREGMAHLSFTYAGSDNVDAVGWYDNTPEIEDVQVVGLKTPNRLGLYDMSGNVWEWCWDWYGSYTEKSVVNPTGVSKGMYRTIRSGSVNSKAAALRVCNRNYPFPEMRNFFIGFRMARGSLTK